MAANDLRILKGGGPVFTFDVEDRDTSGLSATLKVGEPVKIGGTGNNFVTLLATGDPEIGTDRFVGLCMNESTETATADGSVDVMVVVPGKTVIRGKANVTASVDTAAEVLALKNDCVAFDYDSTNFTIDENEGDDPNVHGLVIVGGSEDSDGYLDVMVQEGVGYMGGTVGQTRD